MTLSNKRKAIIEEFKKVRTDAISEMFDHENELGIYPTSKFFNTLDNYLTQVLNDYTQSIIEMVEKKAETMTKVSWSDEPETIPAETKYVRLDDIKEELGK